MTIPSKPSFLPRWARTLLGASSANVATPSSGEQDAGWNNGQNPVSSSKLNWKDQNIYDWLSQLAIALPTAGGYLQGFESATFPPTDGGGAAWSAPSYRFASDAAYVRDTTNPITGTASANRPGTQTASTNSSMGFDIFLLAPSRISFLFDLLCNSSFGDHLDFFVDGVLVGKWSTVSNAVASSGRFVSGPLREGYHSFDWRYVRGASAAVANEKARVDGVAVIPESEWFNWATAAVGTGGTFNRIFVADDFVWRSGTNPQWGTASGSNVGSVAFGDTTSAGGSSMFGDALLTSSATAIGDWEAIYLGSLSGASSSLSNIGAAGNFPFMEAVLQLVSLTNCFCEFGVSDVSAGALNFQNGAAWVYDSSVGTDWRFKTVAAGVATTNPTGIAASTALVQLGISGAAGLTNGNGWIGCIGGSSLPNPAGANHMGATQNLPASTSYTPYVRIGSRTAANAAKLYVDAFQLRGNRGAGVYF